MQSPCVSVRSSLKTAVLMMSSATRLALGSDEHALSPMTATARTASTRSAGRFGATDVSIDVLISGVASSEFTVNGGYWHDVSMPLSHLQNRSLNWEAQTRLELMEQIGAPALHLAAESLKNDRRVRPLD